MLTRSGALRRDLPKFAPRRREEYASSEKIIFGPREFTLFLYVASAQTTRPGGLTPAEARAPS